MNKQSGGVEAVLAIIIIVAFLIGMFFLFRTVDWGAVGSYTPPPQETVVEEKPQTKARCDFTGWGSTSIIEEEAKNGYRFTGRVMQPFCENSLSFELK